MSNNTAFTLPNPNDYETDENGSNRFLEDGIRSLSAWLQTKTFRNHLEKETLEAKIMKHVRSEILYYEECMEEQKKKEKAA